MTVIERLGALRKQMKEKGIDLYVIPTADFHQSEYVGEHFKARAFISNFTGSAGTAVVTQNEARLWTDARYFIQAAKQLEGTSFELMKMGQPGVPDMNDYIKEALPEGGTLGFDGRVISLAAGKAYETMVAQKNAKIVYAYDLVDMVWEDRPALSEKPVFTLAIEYTGESTADKLKRIREAMKEKGATYHVLTTLDDICWTLNMRGDDIDFFPMVLSYAVITMDRMDLYINEAKLSEDIKAAFAKDGVVLHPYHDIYEDVKAIAESETVLLDPARLNYALYKSIPGAVKKVEAPNPEILFKAVKNSVELSNIRTAQVKDSVAHVRFMKWLKENVNQTVITEMSASDQLVSFREEMGNFIRPSFAPICAYGSNAAMCHYSSTEETNCRLQEGNVFLTDTGAGYLEGSTDITRTYALGELPQEIKDHFTLVAMGNLRLSNAKFLKGYTGANLDILARTPFFERDLNFNHGTGHGVGYLLNIHEGPCGFSSSMTQNVPFEAGMVITNEPGIYIEGSHGIRLENEILVCEGVKNEYGQFLQFEILTYIPFDLDAINPDIMTEEDKKMLNNYHKAVYNTISSFLADDEKEWLAHYTREI